MGKGQAWINGQSIGRYWWHMRRVFVVSASILELTEPQNASMAAVNQLKDGIIVPRSWLKPQNNLLVLLEELGGDASKISLVKRTTERVCADTFEHHPTVENWQLDTTGEPKMHQEVNLHLRCDPGESISTIKFASFGTPLGTCGSFQKGACHSPDSHAIIEKMCVGRESCEVTASSSYFQADPCPNVLKRSSIEAICSSDTVIRATQPKTTE